MRLILACLFLLVSFSDAFAAQSTSIDKQRSSVKEKDVLRWLKELESPVYQVREKAYENLRKSRNQSLELVVRHAVDSDSGLDSSARCLKLIGEWENEFGLEVHDHFLELLNHADSESDLNKSAVENVRKLLNEAYDCTEEEALAALKKMTRVLFINKHGYYSLRLRHQYSRANGKSLWPLRYISTPVHISCEDSAKIDDFVVRNLAASPGLECLFCPKMTEAQVAMLGKSKSLVQLYLEESIEDENTLKSLSRIPTLKLLSFDPKQPLNDSLRHLASFRSLNQIFFNRSDIDDPKVLDYLAACSELEFLNLAAFKMPSEKFGNLDRFKSVRHVEVPRYSDGKLIEQVARIPEIESLEIDYCYMTDEHAPFLARHKHLKKLEITNTFITDESCKHIAKITTLEALKLDATFVSPKGVEIIEEAIPGLKVKGWITAAHEPKYVEALQQLQLIGCRVQPDFGVSFKRNKAGKAVLPYYRLPGCDVFFDQDDDPKVNQQFLKYASNVSDLRKLYLSKCTDDFAARLIKLPKSAKLIFRDSHVKEETYKTLESKFKVTR